MSIGAQQIFPFFTTIYILIFTGPLFFFVIGENCETQFTDLLRNHKVYGFETLILEVSSWESSFKKPRHLCV